MLHSSCYLYQRIAYALECLPRRFVVKLRESYTGKDPEIVDKSRDFRVKADF